MRGQTGGRSSEYYGQSGAKSSGGLGQSVAGLMNDPAVDGSSGGYGLPGTGSVNGQSGAWLSRGYSQPVTEPVNDHPESGKSGGLYQLGTGLMTRNRSSTGYSQIETGSSGGNGQSGEWPTNGQPGPEKSAGV